ncbi:MAG TPA: hypothetical protein VHT27_02325 [Solirubrobacteraceae bacterium]|jgi:hypothetical protein|nr:hypothetical protein [Solirubrobacteraceae bacterium]
MTEAIIAGAIVLLLIGGFWWTRGAGGLPGGVDDPAVRGVTSHGESPNIAAPETEDREPPVE